MTLHRIPHRPLLGLLVAVALTLPFGAGARLSDTQLFGAFLDPNVVFLIDNSSSMANVIWHEAYDPAVAPACAVFDNNATYYVHNDFGPPSGPPGTDTTFKPGDQTHCGVKREIFADNAILPEPTQWSGQYLNWYFGLDKNVPAEAAIATEILATGNGVTTVCMGSSSFDKYRRSRLSVARQIIKDVMCEANELSPVRFGLAEFRRQADDASGGYVRVGVDDYDDTHQTNLHAALDSIQFGTSSPLAEALFQLYTYFMHRDDKFNVLGKDDKEKFPKYEYVTSSAFPGGLKNKDLAPPTPVTVGCEKSYVVIVTDGESTRDDFDDDHDDTDKKFDKFEDKLIGDYNDDGEDEEPGPDEKTRYLDDIALFMNTKDMRPDLPGDQHVAVYTIGLTTSADASALLQKTATVGNGLFYAANDIEGLEEAILTSVAAISEDSPSLTAATVPASRVTRNGSFYHAYFEPGGSEFWAGHIKNYDYTLGGEVLDKNGDCALVGDPDPCISGDVDVDPSSAPPFWDAADKMPSPASRTLYVSLKDDMKDGKKLGKLPVVFNTTNVGKDELFIEGKDEKLLRQVGAQGDDKEEVAAEVVEYLRGCELGSAPCVARTYRLGDIFHSVPLLVGSPNGTLNEASYLEFAQTYDTRSEVLYVGANDGFLHGFLAAPWDGTNKLYDRTHADAGKELFGFMPFSAREQIKFLPEPGTGKHYAVDGSPQAADVWFPSDKADITKSKDEWHTVLVGGHRMGGFSYYALDVTDPDDKDPLRPYPAYLWEFPCETGGKCDDWRKWIGETWSEPVITRVRVSVDGNTNGGKGFERWVAVFGGGYYPCTDPNSSTIGEKVYKKTKPITTCEQSDKFNKPGTNKPDKDKAGRAVFMVDISTGKLLAMQNKDKTSGMDFAIPSTPSVLDLDYDGFADVIYFGDVGGNVWKWVVNKVGEFKLNEGHKWEQPNWPFVKFFSAPSYTDTLTSTTYYKSFFNSPTAVLVKGTLWLSMATGEREALHWTGFDDDTETEEENNRVYVVRDLDPHHLAGPHATIAGDATDLEDITDEEDGKCDWTVAKKGFFIRVRDGEKFTTKPVSFMGNVFSPSYLPEDTGNICDGSGNGFLYSFDLFCGGKYLAQPSGTPSGLDKRAIPIAAGLPARPRLTIGDPEHAYAGSGTQPCDSLVVMTSSHGSSTSACAGSSGARPVTNESWRER